MKTEKAIVILRMGEQARWRSGVTVEEEKEAVDMAIEALKGKRPHGEWIPCKDDNFCKCSECNQIAMSEERFNFCPRCGSDNRKRGDHK